MERYKNLSGNSSVVAYEIEEDSITVKFSDSMQYKYSNASAGSQNITQMKNLAILGRGLNSFIMKNVKKNYSSKW